MILRTRDVERRAGREEPHRHRTGDADGQPAQTDFRRTDAKPIAAAAATSGTTGETYRGMKDGRTRETAISIGAGRSAVASTTRAAVLERIHAPRRQTTHTPTIAIPMSSNTAQR